MYVLHHSSDPYLLKECPILFWKGPAHVQKCMHVLIHIESHIFYESFLNGDYGLTTVHIEQLLYWYRF
jgi:hypothetical protein